MSPTRWLLVPLLLTAAPFAPVGAWAQAQPDPGQWSRDATLLRYQGGVRRILGDVLGDTLWLSLAVAMPRTCGEVGRVPL